MDILGLIVLLAIIVFVFWLLVTYALPLVPKPWGAIAIGILAFIVAIGLLQRFGLIPNLGAVKV